MSVRSFHSTKKEANITAEYWESKDYKIMILPGDLNLLNHKYSYFVVAYDPEPEKVKKKQKGKPKKKVEKKSEKESIEDKLARINKNLFPES